MQKSFQHLVDRFRESFDTESRSNYWKIVGDAFRSFLKDKIFNENITSFEGRELDDLDPIIRLLDSNSKRRYEYSDDEPKDELRQRLLNSGSQYGLHYQFEESRNKLIITNVYSVAKAMIPQPRWYKIFYDLKTNSNLRNKLYEVFENSNDKANLIDELKTINDKYTNFLTKPAANAINCLLGVYDFEHFVHVVSLNHRKQIIQHFELGEITENESYGTQIIASNTFILRFNDKYGLDLSALELSHFLYRDYTRGLWDARVSPATNEHYFMLKTGGGEYDDQPESKYNFRKSIPGSVQLLTSENKGKFVYYEKGEFFGTGEIGDITTYEKDGITYYNAQIKNFEKKEPIKYGDFRNKLSTSLRRSGIQKISKQDYEIIIDLLNAEKKHSMITYEFLKKDLELSFDKINFNPLLFEDETILKAQIFSALIAGKNIMLVGPPGTGKTEIALSLCKTAIAEEYIHGFVLTTATSDWTTFDTIGGYVPSRSGDFLEFMPGQFLRCFKEGDNPANKWLIIDEINRSDIDKAFGQLFTVLSGQNVELPFQQASENVTIIPAQNFVKTEIHSSEYVIPKSWRLLATLNTYDKASLYQMSYAFMRRFAFIYVNVPSSQFIDTHWNQYLNYWKIEDTDPLRICIDNVKEIWKTMNEIGSKRPLGPAIIKDMLDYIAGFKSIYDSFAASGNEANNQIITSAVSSYILPQFEGLSKTDLDDLKNRLEKYCIPSLLNTLFIDLFEG